MSNPATQALLDQLDRPDLRPFVAAWDEFEALVIAIHRQKVDPTAAQGQFQTVRAALLEGYPALASQLVPFISQVRVQGQPLANDPFRHLLTPETPTAWLEDWPRMQVLPAAREALNLYLLSILQN
jgi:hypothetical protein